MQTLILEVPEKIGKSLEDPSFLNFGKIISL